MTGEQAAGDRNMKYYPVRNTRNAGITEVLPGLYISGICALEPSTLKDYNITLIINATSEVPNSASFGKIPRMKIWLEDSSEAWILSYLHCVCDQILEVLSGGGRVLIHSVQGVSRCSTICLAFLTKYRFKRLSDAYMFLASVRPKVEPNIGFWRQLISFEKELKQNFGSVRIIRDRNNPSIVVPDVYQKFAMQRRKQCQIQNDANTGSEETVPKPTPESLQPQSAVYQVDPEKSSKQPELSTINSAAAVAVLSMTTVAAGVAGASAGIAHEITEQRRANKYIPRKKNSLRFLKYTPVLEPLPEAIEVGA